MISKTLSAIKILSKSSSLSLEEMRFQSVSSQVKSKFVPSRINSIELNKIHDDLTDATEHYLDYLYKAPLIRVHDTEDHKGYRCIHLNDGKALKQLVDIGLLPVSYDGDSLKPWSNSFLIGTNCLDNTKSLIVVDKNSYVYRYTGPVRIPDGKWITSSIDDLAGGGRILETAIEALPFDVNVRASYARLLHSYGDSDGLTANYLEMVSSRTINTEINSKGNLLFQFVVALTVAETHRDSNLAIVNFALADLLQLHLGEDDFSLPQFLVRGLKVKFNDQDIRIHYPTAPEGSVGQIGLISIGDGSFQVTRPLYGGAIKLNRFENEEDIPEKISKSKIVDIVDGEYGFVHRTGPRHATIYNTYGYPTTDNEDEMDEIDSAKYKDSFVRVNEDFFSYVWNDLFNSRLCITLQDVSDKKPNFIIENSVKIVEKLSSKFSLDNDERILYCPLHSLKKSFDCKNHLDHSFSNLRDSLNFYSELLALNYIIAKYTADEEEIGFNEVNLSNSWTLTKEVVDSVNPDIKNTLSECYKCIDSAFREKLSTESTNLLCGAFICNDLDY